MLLQCPAISLDWPAEWKADTRYLTQITSECQNILTSIFCLCRVYTQLLVFAMKNTTTVLKKKEKTEKENKSDKKTQTVSWTLQSTVKFKFYIQRSYTTIDDIKEFLAGLIELVSTFISAHVICSSPSQSCPFLHDMLCLFSKNKTERVFLWKNAAASPKDSSSTLWGQLHQREDERNVNFP